MMTDKDLRAVNFVLENELRRILNSKGFFSFVDEKIKEYKMMIESDRTDVDAEARFITLHDAMVEYKEVLNGKLPF